MAGLLLLALFLFFLPAGYQAPIRSALRGTALRPFLAIQREIVERRGLGIDIAELRARHDSLAAVAAAQATLAEENRRLRALLGLRARAEQSFKSAEVMRLGVEGAESSFLLDIGAADGVEVGSPVLTPDGLLGVVWEVDEHVSHAIDWTHPEFRASAMTMDGQVYGLVEPRRGGFREEDLLVLSGAPFHSDIQPGTRIVTSGRGGIYPRGIPLGSVVGIEEADTGWRKSYLLRPAVRPEAASHVLVGIRQDRGGEGDLSKLWPVGGEPDTAAAAFERESEAAEQAPDEARP
ncbi:MAG TPA: rod shape-determining protein MreC [Longimicrobiales bacterium]